MFIMITINGHITLSCTGKYSLNERKLKKNTHIEQDLCLGFSRWSLNIYIITSSDEVGEMVRIIGTRAIVDALVVDGMKK